MEESEKENLFITFKGVIDSIIDEKRNNPKRAKLLENFKAKINLGLQMTEDYIFWLNLVAENGNFSLSKGRLDEYDLELIAAPEDLMYFSNREYSTLHMLTKKNRFGNKKLKFSKGSDGKMNFGILLKLPKILVLEKIKPKK
ncbi:MAG: hypothetical protein ACTSUL_04085 [Promethearchaeota archaeon]